MPSFKKCFIELFFRGFSLRGVLEIQLGDVSLRKHCKDVVFSFEVDRLFMKFPRSWSMFRTDASYTLCAWQSSDIGAQRTSDENIRISPQLWFEIMNEKSRVCMSLHKTRWTDSMRLQVKWMIQTPFLAIRFPVLLKEVCWFFFC